MDLRQKQIVAAELSGCIAAGRSITLGVKSDGTVLASRYFAEEGQKPDGTPRFREYNRFGEADVGDWRDVVAVETTSDLTAGLRTDGTVVCAGKGGNVKPQNVQAWRDVVQISAGSGHIVGLRSDGTVVAEGFNGKNQCNTGDWHDVTAVAAGAVFTVGLRGDGSVICAGFGNRETVDLGWSGVVSVAAGDDYALGLRADGTVLCQRCPGEETIRGWRDIVAVAAHGNAYGVKADGTVVATRIGKKPVEAAKWKNIVAIAANTGAHVVGLRADGTVVEETALYTVGISRNGTVYAPVPDENGEDTVSGWKLFDDSEREWERRSAQEWHVRAEKAREATAARAETVGAAVRAEAARAAEARRKAAEEEKRRREQIARLEGEQAALRRELAGLEARRGLRGLFTGRQKTDLKIRINRLAAEINRKKADSGK